VSPNGWDLRLNADVDLAARRLAEARRRRNPLDAKQVSLLTRDMLPGWYDEWLVGEQEEFHLPHRRPCTSNRPPPGPAARTCGWTRRIRRCSIGSWRYGVNREPVPGPGNQPTNPGLPLRKVPLTELLAAAAAVDHSGAATRGLETHQHCNTELARQGQITFPAHDSTRSSVPPLPM
jgi:hypothetical protein